MKIKSLLLTKSTLPFLLFIGFTIIFIACENDSRMDYKGLTTDGTMEEMHTEATEEAFGNTYAWKNNGIVNNKSQAPIEGHKPTTVNQAPKSLKVIKSGSMQYQVERLEAAKAELNYLVNKYEAYYSNEKLDQQSYQKVYQLNIRIPSANYESFVQDLEQKGLGELQDKQISAQDVSEEYVDLETRLKNKRAYIDRYNGLLKQAKNMEDVLKIQEKIRVLEEEIDRAQGRLRFLSDRVGYGTLNVMLKQEIEQEIVEVEEDTFLDEFKRSIGYGWSGLLGFILVIFALWPWLILIAASLIVFRRWRKKRKS